MSEESLPSTAVETYAEVLRLRRLKPRRRSPPEILTAEAKSQLEARKKRLIAQKEKQEYAELVKNVASSKFVKGGSEYGQVMRQMNQQVTIVFNTLVTVGGAFAFGFFGSQMVAPNLDLGGRLFLGLTLATVVFFADLYFIIKEM